MDYLKSIIVQKVRPCSLIDVYRPLKEGPESKTSKNRQQGEWRFNSSLDIRSTILQAIQFTIVQVIICQIYVARMWETQYEHVISGGENIEIGEFEEKEREMRTIVKWKLQVVKLGDGSSWFMIVFDGLAPLKFRV